jgi:hypothetical protein
MLAFVGILALLSGIDGATQNIILLASLMAVMTILLLLLLPVGALIIPAMLGLIALTAMAIPMLAFIGVIALMSCIEGAQANAQLMITLMSTMATMLIQIALVGPLAIIGVTALTMLMGLMVVMGAFIAVISAILTVCPDLEQFIDTAIPILVKMAHGMGEMVSAFLTGMLSGLPEIGALLSSFAMNAQPFFTIARTVDGTVLAGAGIMAAAILALTVAELLNGLATFMTGGSSLPALGAQLSQFMTNAMPFILGASLISDDMMSGVKALA